MVMIKISYSKYQKNGKNDESCDMIYKWEETNGFELFYFFI
mgnify:CR=1 FL=1